MDRLPYFCWYPADAETDENFKSMTDAEVGFYLRCLNHSWINGGIPSDPNERARALNRTRRSCDNLWLRVGRCFTPDPENPFRMINPRQELERSQAQIRSAAARQAGLLSGKARRTGVQRRLNESSTRAAGSASASDSKLEGGAGGNQEFCPLTDDEMQHPAARPFMTEGSRFISRVEKADNPRRYQAAVIRRAIEEYESKRKAALA